MTNRQPPSKAIHAALWLAQISLAAVLLWAGFLKLFQPIEKLAAMWPWTGQVPAALVKFTGIADGLGAIGLILPALLRRETTWTPVTALGIVALMIVAGIFHVARGEGSVIGVNVVVALMAAFIAWGRFRKAPVPSK